MLVVVNFLTFELRKRNSTCNYLKTTYKFPINIKQESRTRNVNGLNNNLGMNGKKLFLSLQAKGSDRN